MALAGQAANIGFQLIISVPMLENWANVLQRHFGYTAHDAIEQADVLHAAASDGPLQTDPILVLGADFVPFASEAETVAAAAALAVKRTDRSKRGVAPLFDEITDDRHVLLTAIAGRADALVTANIEDFRIRKSIGFPQDEVFVVQAGNAEVVVCKPGFAARLLRNGIVPSAAYLRAHAAEPGLGIDKGRS
jgi:hypothetical protein